MVEPLSTRYGLAQNDPSELGTAILRAWDAFLVVVDGADLERPSRLAKLTGRDLCVHLGTWDDHEVLSGLVSAARGKGPDRAPDVDRDNSRLLAAHRESSVAEVRAALQRSRDEVATWFEGDEPTELGRHPVQSSVGRLPLLSVLHAGSYELAVHAVDLGPCGAPAADAPLLQEGLSALMDVTGALCVQSGIDITVTAQTPAGGWSFTSEGDGWEVTQVAAGRFEGVGVTGTAKDLLDASAGRAQVPSLLVQRKLKVQELTSFMRLAPLLDDVPGLPGGPVLKAGISGVSSVTGGVSRLLGRLRG